MKVIILTTDTPHHNYLVREIRAFEPNTEVLVETAALKPPFDTSHEYEKRRDEYEWAHFFGGKQVRLSELAPVKEFASVNEKAFQAHLSWAKPDVVIVIGTGVISAETIAICPDGFINLHGGDPEEYRGLDSHLWAIYHGDYDGLIAALHLVNAKLDDGAIIGRQKIELKPGMKLHELRAENVKVCRELVLNALEDFKKHGKFSSTPQKKKGRNYSFMPSVLKEICVRKFEKYTSKLD